MINADLIIESSEFRQLIANYIDDFKVLSLENLVTKYEFNRSYSSKNSNYWKNVEGNEDLKLNIRVNNEFTEITLENKIKNEEENIKKNDYQIVKKVSLDNDNSDTLVFTKYNKGDHIKEKNKNWSFSYILSNDSFGYFYCRESHILKEDIVRDILNNFIFKDVTFECINDIYILNSDNDFNHDQIAQGFLLSLIDLNNSYLIRTEKRKKEDLVLHNIKVKESIRKLMKG